jgi:hypothetical protein
MERTPEGEAHRGEEGEEGDKEDGAKVTDGKKRNEDVIVVEMLRGPVGFATIHEPSRYERFLDWLWSLVGKKRSWTHEVEFSPLNITYAYEKEEEVPEEND